jgi:signal peptidase I
MAVGGLVGAATVGIAAVLLLAGGSENTQTYTVPSEAMFPTFAPGDSITVNLNAYKNAAPSLGDVVVFHPPKGADNGVQCGLRPQTGEPCSKPTPTASSQIFLKRIVAGPGDTLSIRSGHPVVNGNVVSEEAYAAPCGSAEACNMPRTITIPPGDYFVLGDNRGASDDSRFWGPVPQEQFIGRVE